MITMLMVAAVLCDLRSAFLGKEMSFEYYEGLPMYVVEGKRLSFVVKTVIAAPKAIQRLMKTVFILPSIPPRRRTLPKLQSLRRPCHHRTHRSALRG